jgi:hypothetical protein
MIASKNTVRINFDTQTDISICDNFDVEYIDPDGVTGTWAGALSGTEIIQVDYLYGILKAGLYKVKAKAYTGTTLYFTSPNWGSLEIAE